MALQRVKFWIGLGLLHRHSAPTQLLTCQHRWGSLLKLQKEGKLSVDMSKMVEKVLGKVAKVKADRKGSKVCLFFALITRRRKLRTGQG
jgi:hypothetical protein